MFDEPHDIPAEPALSPVDRARERSDEFRMHAELCAVFEGPRKFGAAVMPGLGPDIALDCQRAMVRLEKSRSPGSPALPRELSGVATRILLLPHTTGLTTGDYHIHRRPGEVTIIRWLEADQVQTFYDRLQAHFDAALSQHLDDERANAWKGDDETAAYLEALEKIEVRMDDRYARQAIRSQSIFVLSTQAADELDILHLCDFIMNVPPAEVVGAASAPPAEAASEADRAWYFKLFSLRGVVRDVERMCFLAFLQK